MLPSPTFYCSFETDFCHKVLQPDVGLVFADSERERKVCFDLVSKSNYECRCYRVEAFSCSFHDYRTFWNEIWKDCVA